MSRELKAFSEDTILEVGKYYNVPCYKEYNSFRKRTDFIPVINVLHKDPQIGVDEMHYHFDGRFMNDDWLFDGLTNRILLIPEQDDIIQFQGIVVKRKKCLRLITGINPPERHRAEKYHAWYDEQIGKSCKGRKCPHLGVKMHERGGKLVCPLHDLIGDIETEKIIPHSEKPLIV